MMRDTNRRSSLETTKRKRRLLSGAVLHVSMLETMLPCFSFVSCASVLTLVFNSCGEERDTGGDLRSSYGDRAKSVSFVVGEGQAGPVAWTTLRRGLWLGAAFCTCTCISPIPAYMISNCIYFSTKLTSKLQWSWGECHDNALFAILFSKAGYATAVNSP
jgi:hypothetical protein